MLKVVNNLTVQSSKLLNFRHLSESHFLLDALHRRSNFAKFCHDLMQNHLSLTVYVQKSLFYLLVFKKSTTVFDLITAHTPISAQSRNSVVFRLQPVYFFLYFFTKAYVVGTHLNCIEKSMQFK